MTKTKDVTKEMRDQLRKPLPKEALKQHPTKTYLTSIKPVFILERLSEVFGTGSWQVRTRFVERSANGAIVVKTSLTIPDYGIYYESFGGNNNGGEDSKNFDLGDAYKGATTDGLTKICSYLEIGIDVFKGKEQAHKTVVEEPVKSNGSHSSTAGVTALPWFNVDTPEFKEAIAKKTSLEEIKKTHRVSKATEATFKSLTI